MTGGTGEPIFFSLRGDTRNKQNSYRKENKFDIIPTEGPVRDYSDQVEGPTHVALAGLVRFWVVFGRLGGVKEEMPSARRGVRQSS